MKISRKAQNRFYYIKKLINDTNDTKELIDCFYFNKKAIQFVEKLKKDFFINSYYNLTTANILLDIHESENISDVKKHYFNMYDNYTAKAWFENFLYVLESDINV